ncbi:hypothetical protein [Pseudomonas xanthosomatis]|uniref:hypothetical protein n=1 Tax=Pseudomonas xanthosomatis TaxID=2842356 RepID=UPI003519AF70
MEMWELAKRILASANAGQSFTPSLVGGNFHRELEASGDDGLPPVEDIHRWSDLLAENMKFAGLIESAPRKPGHLAILDVMRRTEFGDELYEVLQQRDMVSALTAMQITIDAGAISRVLHQLKS